MAFAASLEDGLESVVHDAGRAEVFRLHATRYDPQPQSDRTVTLGYDRRRFPELLSRATQAAIASDFEVLRTVLVRCERLLPTSLTTAEAVLEGTLETLASFVGVSDAESRRRAAHCIALMCNTAPGRAAVVADAELGGTGVVGPISALVNDPEASVRREALQATEYVATSPEGAVVLVKAGFVDQLATRAKEEDDEACRALALRALARCAQAPGREGVIAAVTGDALGVCVDLLCHGVAVEEAATALHPMSILEDGKARILRSDAVGALARVWAELVAQLDAAEAAALAEARGERGAATPAGLARVVAEGHAGATLASMLVVDDAGKRQLLESGSLASLSRLVEAPLAPAFHTVVARVIAAVCSLEPAREQLRTLRTLERLRRRLVGVEDGTEALSPLARGPLLRALTAAIEAVSWAA